MVLQSELLKTVDELIDRVAKQATIGASMPTQRQLQAFILTNIAFLGLTCEDAADAMGIKVGTVWALLHQLKTDFPCFRLFETGQGYHTDDEITMRRLDDVDEETERIIHIF